MLRFDVGLVSVARKLSVLRTVLLVVDVVGYFRGDSSLLSSSEARTRKSSLYGTSKSSGRGGLRLYVGAGASDMAS